MRSFLFVTALQKSDGSNEQEGRVRAIRWTFYCTLIGMCDVVVVVLLLIIFAGDQSTIVQTIAMVLGGVTIAGTLTQFLPQIWTTFRCKVCLSIESTQRESRYERERERERERESAREFVVASD
jgi:hypothetical protein